jgi:hypothetical protein
MDTAFVAQWFNEKDRFLASEIDRVLYSHGVRPITGHHLGGGAMEDGVKSRIDACHCLIALATQRGQLATGEWTTHPWVIYEYGYAKAQGKKAIALVESGVDWQGMYAAHEYILLDRQPPSDALLKLSITMGGWKEQAGQTWKLQVLPNEIAEKLALEGANRDCKYRTFEQGRYSGWSPITPVPEPGGVFLYVTGLNDRQLIEIKVSTNRTTWQSPATPQSMPVILRELR